MNMSMMSIMTAISVQRIRFQNIARKRTIVRILNSLQLFEKIDSTNDTCQKSLV